MEVINFARIDGLYSEHQRRIAAVISDIFPTVRLLRMEPGHPSFDPERPFALVDEPNLSTPYHIRNLYESEIDSRLVAWLLDNNTHDPNSKVNKLHLLEMAEAAINAKKEEEWRAERKDVLKSAMKSHKSTWSHDGKTLRK
jgi:hypothetical protein